MTAKLEAINNHSTSLILARRFRRAAGFVPSGVAVLSTGDVAMTVSSLHCVSFHPPFASVALAKESRKAATILESGRFHARVLRSGEEDLARGEKDSGKDGMVDMECVIAAKHEAGDHHLILARVEEVGISSGCPLIYWRRGLHRCRPQYDFVAARERFEEFLAAWVGGTLPKKEWTHASHVAIGAFYAVRYPGEAFEKTKQGIIRYNEAVGTENSATSGYHETLTRFWANVLAKFAIGFTDAWETAREAVERFGEERDLHHLYYSFDVVRSTEARRSWVPPDLDGQY
ncbi:MAG TPA: flavin reductase family protein [Candidatus Acidoferrum sp.]|nr:flavin reductase family protein [Candidatus Acidoferrum sp.]